jgi:[calcium/calmodulin-dependent protein kinase] kinase
MIRRIGQGKFAKVDLCADVNTNIYYAAKIMDKLQLRRKAISRTVNAYSSVKTEMAVMKSLDHPHILKLFEVIDDPNENKLYLIMEFVKNGNLVKKVNLDRGFTTDPNYPPMRKYLRQLVMGLEYCHDVVKIIHRDIKPENILIDENDDVKLADFGVSSILPDTGCDKVSNNAGSAVFFSPEACIGDQYRGRLNDIWAIGITLYFMATGKYPFICNDY